MGSENKVGKKTHRFAIIPQNSMKKKRLLFICFVGTAIAWAASALIPSLQKSRPLHADTLNPVFASSNSIPRSEVSTDSKVYDSLENLEADADLI